MQMTDIFSRRSLDMDLRQRTYVGLLIVGGVVIKNKSYLRPTKPLIVKNY